MRRFKLDEDLIEFLSKAPVEFADLSPRVLNGCKRLQVTSMINLFRMVSNKERGFMNTFGLKSINEIKIFFLERGIISDKEIYIEIRNFYERNQVSWKIFKNHPISPN